MGNDRPDDDGREVGQPDSPTELSGDENEQLFQRIVDTITPDSRLIRVELLITVVLAVASVLIAWAALQSAKWSGEQAIHFSEAGANRTESTRFDNRATSLILLDTQTFLQWGQAVQTEAILAAESGVERSDPTNFDPANPTLSGYFFSLFREEFRLRVVVWLEGGGASNPAGSSPFLPFQDYIDESVPAAAESARLAEVAEERSALARVDNQNSDDYVITVVILATVLFFAGVSNKMKSRPNQNLMVFLTLAMMTWGIVRLATLPIHAIP
jgi:hypothetical protein